MLRVHQGNRSAAEYAIRFRTLAAQSGWNNVALKTVFREGLNHELQVEIACKDETSDLSQYITMAIKLDKLIRNKPRSKQNKMAPVPVEASPLSMFQSTEPMQISYTRVSSEEQHCRLQEHLCFYCDQPNHHCNTFPNKTNNTSRKMVSNEYFLNALRQNLSLLRFLIINHTMFQC